MKTIGFAGAGQMAEALMKGILSADVVTPDALFFLEPAASRQKYIKETYGITSLPDYQQLLETCQTILFAVKPQVMPAVLEGMRPYVTEKHLFITIAAGLPISSYETALERTDLAIIRVMPNTPALVLEGASAISCNANVNDDGRQLAEKIFNAIGIVRVLDERYLDAVTGLSGSGPAYVYTFIEGLIDAGVKVGLTRADSEELAVQTVLGATRLVQQEKKHPAVLRAMVTSPGGTTIAGQHVLENSGFRGIIMDAVEAATIRSEELGRQ